MKPYSARGRTSVASISHWRLFARATTLGIRIPLSAGCVGCLWILDRSLLGALPAQAKAARRIVRTIERLGATYVKFGQLVASRPDILPTYLTAEFSKLFDNVTPMTPTQFDEQWRGARNRNPRLADLKLTGRCLGSGSIACVYEAYDQSGHRLAVKIQRPAIAATIATDLALIASFTRIAEKLPAAGGAPLADLIGFMSRAIYGQIDFGREAQHTQKLAQNLRLLNGVLVPAVRTELSDSGVLVTEYIAGLSENLPTSLDPNARSRSAALALAAVGQMVFSDGFVHCDLHPGNLYIRSDGIVVFLDAGYCVDLPDPIREHLSEFFHNLESGNGQRCGEIMFDSALNAGTGPNRAGFVDSIVRLVSSTRGSNHRFDMIEFGQGVFETQNRYGVHPPADFAFPLLSLMIAEGTLRRFWPDLQIPMAVTHR